MDARRCRAFATGAILVGLWLTAVPATYASNGNKPRVQVRWPDGSPCIETYDKRVQTQVHFAYGFDGADDIKPANSEDEVEDSRRHQFFASCRHRHRQESFPRWISRADFNRAQAFGFPLVDPGPKGILEESPEWAQCTSRITPDATRLPITQARARQGFHWDIQNIPSGTYMIDAYTWEPPENLWTHPSRPGVVRIWDSGQDPAPPPAAAIDGKPSIGFVGQAQIIQACVDAQPGATITWSVASLPPLGVPPQWIPQGGPAPAQNGPLQWSFTPPAPPDPMIGVSKWMLRLSVQEPSGRQYHAYSRADLLALDPSVDAEFVYEPPPPPPEGCAVSRPSKQGTMWFGLVFVVAAFSSGRPKTPRNR